MLKKFSSKEGKNQFGNRAIIHADTSKSTIKNVDLDLEVEMDDGIHEILASPNKHKSTLLDVTILKQKNLDSVYQIDTTTLNGQQARDFITNMEFEKHYKKKLIDKILKKKLSLNTINKIQHVKKSESKIQVHADETRTTVRTKDLSKHIQHFTAKKSGGGDRVEQVFTSPRTYNDLFTCKNRRQFEDDKNELPCTCKNCALLGIVEDSQKRPMMETTACHLNERPIRNRQKPSKSNENLHSEDVHVECKYYFKYLSSKIKYLEARLAKQEERAVPKDYFRKIITKLVGHIGKIANQGQQSDKNVQANETGRAFKTKHRHESNNGMSNRFTVHTALNEDHKASGPFWKWGEEIVKPGVDLKNRIQNIVDEQLLHFKEELNRPEGRKFGEIPAKVCNSDSTIYAKKNCRRQVKREKKVQHKDKIEKKLGAGSELSFNIDMSDDLDSDTAFKTKSRNSDICKSKNQKVTPCTFNFSFTDKLEFLKTISNTREDDRVQLWKSIWKQALVNGQTKNDKVTIQIPRFLDENNKPVEIQYTIGELEALLIKKPFKLNSKLERMEKLLEKRKRRHFNP